MNRGKKKIVYIDDDDEEKYRFLLKLMVCSAEDLDDSNVPANQRFYQVVFWVYPRDERKTRVCGSLNPIWDTKNCIELDKPLGDDLFLYLEVVRCGVRGKTPDPGTSTGRKIVGRTRISLPAVGKKTFGRFGLVKNDFDNDTPQAKGHITLKLEMHKRIIYNSRDYYD
ncbi:hypothetical protein M5689_011733 [Euphorbia peplus]|nr:hypothetical protein M5689_011733 [Euphorbia peplus]